MTVDPGPLGRSGSPQAPHGPDAATGASDGHAAPRVPPWRRFLRLPLGLRLASYTAVVLVIVLVALTLTSVVLVRRSLPQTTGTIELAGLGGPVEVLRDGAGVAQIYAGTTEDLMFAQGFVAAQERFFEMDVRRHATAGRLAELFGEDALASDVAVRTLGWRQVAEAELPLLEPETRIALDAYAKGVNAYLADRSPGAISLEYTVLGVGGLDYRPQQWTSVDSLAWLKAVAWDLRGNMQDEIDRVLTIAAVGRRRAAELDPAHDDGQSDPIVTQGAVVDGVFEQDATSSGTRNPVRPPTGPAYDGGRGVLRGLDALGDLGRGLGAMPDWLGRGDGVGSNSWVVAGEHTDTGAPLLAGDPHLGVSAPGALLQVGLHCRDLSAACPYDVSGFSWSGMPGVVVGHNLDIAWSMSNLGADVTDLYVERVTDTTWRRGRIQLPLRVRTETVEVEDGDDVTFTVRETDHGPIVSDTDKVLADVAATAPMRRPAGDAATDESGETEEYAVSLSWTGLDPAPTADAILALDRADDWSSFRQALSSFAAPAQSVVYADRDGHVGYQAAGLVPIRKSGNDGRLPSPGWRADNDWTGEHVPFDGLPNVLDPEGGVVVAANQAAVGDDYPYLLTEDWDRGYRAQRIDDLVRSAINPVPGDTDVGVSLAELAAMQLDDRNPLGPVLTPYLLRADLPGGYYSDGQVLLRTWDFDQPADSAAAAYFNVVWRNLLQLTFHDELPEAVWPDGGQQWVAVITRLLDDPTNDFWDDATTDERETRDQVVEQAMRDARDELTSRVAVRADEWSWGDLHELDLRSEMMGGRSFGWLFNRDDRPAAGGGTSVNATAWDAAEGYEVSTAPSMRMVVSLGGPDAIEGFDQSRWVNLTGVSGHAFDSHYTDQAERWLEGRTLPWVFSEDAVRASTEDTLTLAPPDVG